MKEFDDQVVLITGAKGGLGTSVTRAFLAKGAMVAGSSKSIQDSDFANPHFAGIPADLTVAESARELVEAAMGRFGKIDALVHVMGGFAGGAPIPETGDDTWDLMMNLNLRAAFNVLRAVIPPMRQARRGRIVAISSRQAVEPAANLCAYNTSKAALVALIRTAALENQDAGITANTILPGTMNTEANRKASPDADPSKWVQTEHVASLTAFLVSEAGGEITGAAIPVYGSDF
ncbi:MAG TPA: SDR family NAD(P)-dependent oxidoreductase [Bryobacteraceae bacterium]|jgi:NAD(P)-dependent dehydrogenase (short-subunit alcohol dehydrogenase family)|nr:SDR family NAD(P)-dependent oxidoreductase [Bryobacteraceae bacterium]